MSKKIIVYIVLVVCIVVAGVYAYFGRRVVEETQQPVVQTEATSTLRIIPSGTYVIAPKESTLHWALNKPLIEGYVNSGTIPIATSTISIAIGGALSGTISFQVKDIVVGDTPKKPGMEEMLAKHLKSPDFFDTTKFPLAEFRVVSATRGGNDVQGKTFYTVVGALTMKGVTRDVSFPVVADVREDKALVATADFELDRTQWGITYGSGSFFSNLGNNIIGDRVKLSFSLIAYPEPEIDGKG